MNGPPPHEKYDHSVDEREHSVEQWKELIYREVTEYELTHLWPPTTSTSSSVVAPSSVVPNSSNSPQATPATASVSSSSSGASK